jgi:SPP1 gp7 family putative phage head morphogenesis protein
MPTTNAAEKSQSTSNLVRLYRLQAPVDQYERFRSTHRFGALIPSRVDQILTDVDIGRIDEWQELVSFALERDTHLDAIHQTRTEQVVQARWEIIPGRSNDPQSQAQAIKAAKFVSDVFSEIPDLEWTFSRMMDAVAGGFSAQELVWIRRFGANVIHRFEWVNPARFRYDEMWKLRLYDYGRRAGENGYGEELFPDLWLIHQSSNKAGYPSKYGTMRTCIWPFCFRHWTEKYWLHSGEKYGQPLSYATVPENTPDETVAKVQEALENLSYDHASVFKEGVKIVIEGGPIPAGYGDMFEKYLTYAERCLTKEVLGTSDAVDPGKYGNQSAIASRVETTQKPKQLSDARKLWGTMREQAFEPLLRNNLHLFNSVMPPLPRGQFEFEMKAEAKPVPEVSTQPTPQPGNQVINPPAAPINEAMTRGMLDSDIDKIVLKLTKKVMGTLREDSILSRKPANEDVEDTGDFLLLSDDDKATVVKRIGRPGELVVSSTYAMADALKVVREQIIDGIRKTKNATDFKSLMKSMSKAILSDKQIRSIVHDSMGKSLLAGQMMIAKHETKTSEMANVFTFADSDPEPPAFLNMPWKEALDAFKKMPLFDEKGFNKIEKSLDDKTDVVLQDLVAQLRKKSREQVAKMLEEGGTYADYADALQDESQRLGIEPQDPAYLQMVFRTNINTAYGAGRWMGITESGRGYWQLRTMEDGRVRDAHRPLDMLVFRVGNPETDRLFPPNDYNDRCTGVSLSSWDGEVIESDAAYQDAYGDGSFKQNPVSYITG